MWPNLHFEWTVPLNFKIIYKWTYVKPNLQDLLSLFGVQPHIFMCSPHRYTSRKVSRKQGKFVMFYSLTVQNSVFVSEPRINSSDQEILQPKSGPELPIILQCNLTNSHSTHQESFWMKNGQEIANTKTEHKHTLFKWDFNGKCAFCFGFTDWMCGMMSITTD